MPEPFDRLLAATQSLDAPLAIIDEPALWANAEDLVRRASGVPIRVASKSVRVRSVVEAALARDGFAGVMSYSLEESVWLADLGVADLLLAYPTASASGVRALIAEESRLAAITLMIDSTESLDLLDRLAGPGHPVIGVCIDVDASLRMGPVHLGVRRSPVHSVADAARLAAGVVGRPGFELRGVMFYDAQIAGLPDSSPAVRLVKRRSAAELLERRAKVVAAVREHADLRIVNAGGTGSLEVSGADPAVTELTAGSGLFSPGLFDDYDAFESRPAAYFALDVVRRPTDDVATLFSGGYIASGAAQKNRLPKPTWPEGLRLLGAEGAGEVQTPVKGRAARDLRLGDRVLLRHAKAGELCERFDTVAIVGVDGDVHTVPTYRGERKNFG